MKTVIVIVAVVLVGGAIVAAFVWVPKKEAAPSVSGTLETDEVQAASRYGGRVSRIFVNEGEVVKAGALVVELEAAELKAEEKEASAMLAELRAGARPQELQAAQDEWESQKAELDFARSEARRSEGLFKQDTISETERERAVSRALMLEKSVAAARSRYELLEAGTRPERIAQAEAKLEGIRAHLKEMRITAPSDCFVEVLLVKAGDVLGPNAPAATLLLRDHLWVRVYVPEPWLGFIREGEKVKARADSFPDRLFEGTVEQMNRQAEFTPRNAQTPEERIKLVFGVKVRFANLDVPLRPGMSVDLFFPGVPKARGILAK